MVSVFSLVYILQHESSGRGITYSYASQVVPLFFPAIFEGQHEDTITDKPNFGISTDPPSHFWCSLRHTSTWVRSWQLQLELSHYDLLHQRSMFSIVKISTDNPTNISPLTFSLQLALSQCLHINKAPLQKMSPFTAIATQPATTQTLSPPTYSQQRKKGNKNTSIDNTSKFEQLPWSAFKSASVGLSGFNPGTFSLCIIHSLWLTLPLSSSSFSFLYCTFVN